MPLARAEDESVHEFAGDGAPVFRLRSVAR
jgi:hypothetical protein